MGNEGVSMEQARDQEKPAGRNNKRSHTDGDVDNGNSFNRAARQKLDAEMYQDNTPSQHLHTPPAKFYAHAKPFPANSEDGSADPSHCHEAEASDMQLSESSDKSSAPRSGILSKRKGSRPVIKVKLKLKNDIEKDHGKYLYVLEVTRDEDLLTNEMERANQMAESAATLLLQAEILRDMGERLRAQYRESIQSIF